MSQLVCQQQVLISCQSLTLKVFYNLLSNKQVQILISMAATKQYLATEFLKTFLVAMKPKTLFLQGCL